MIQQTCSGGILCMHRWWRYARSIGSSRDISRSRIDKDEDMTSSVWTRLRRLGRLSASPKITNGLKYLQYSTTMPGLGGSCGDGVLPSCEGMWKISLEIVYPARVCSLRVCVLSGCKSRDDWLFSGRELRRRKRVVWVVASVVFIAYLSFCGGKLVRATLGSWVLTVVASSCWLPSHVLSR